MTKPENKVVNTAKQIQDIPELSLLISVGGSGAIEAQERAGTQQAAQSSVLPTDGLADYAEGGPYAYLGIKVLEPVKDDDMFTYVELPKGWSVKTTDHSMHNDIVDDKGRIRSSYFYKAAFYDRSAQMYPPKCRYIIDIGPKHSWGDGAKYKEKIVVDTVLNVNPTNDDRYEYDPMSILASFGRKHGPEEMAYAVDAELMAEAVAWLKKKYPDYKNPAAYWD